MRRPRNGFRIVLAPVTGNVAPVAVEKTVTPATASKAAPFINSLGMRFAPVPITGGPTAGQRVLFAIWETRVQDWEVFSREQRRNVKKADFEQTPADPALRIQWQEAKDFCAWLTNREQKAGLLPADLEYRLPSDHEWSCAVGIGAGENAAALPKEKHWKIKDVYPWGKVWPPPENAGNYRGAEAAQVADGYGIISGWSDRFPHSAPVGSFAPNEFGLFDLGGNAAEWCEDLFGEATSGTTRGADFRVGDQRALWSSARGSFNRAFPYPNVGFRAVLAPVSHPSSGGGSGNPPAASRPAAATKGAPFVNSLGMRFVPVPIKDGPTNGQRVLFGIWDVRVQDYAAFATETKREWPKPDFQQGPTHPAVLVNWEDATAFCAWLTERERNAGTLAANERYRLPTDHEWSCAAGLGDREDAAKTPAEKDQKIKGVFPWGDQWPPPKGVGNLLAIDGYDDGFANTSPVGSFPANQFGLYDISGNVWQLCDDWYDGDALERVMRGGSFTNYSGRHLLSSFRDHHPSSMRLVDHGFRIVLAPVSGIVPPAAVAKAVTLAAATKDAPFANSLGMKFVPVPITGGPTSGERVLFSIWEARVQDYKAFNDETKHGWEKPGFEQGPTHPAVEVSWNDARAFCEWLTKRELEAGKIGTDWRYRLPTDHEWSCAVGLGERENPTLLPSEKTEKIGDEFPWGKTWPPTSKVGNYAGEELSALVAKGGIPGLSKVLGGHHDGFANTAPVGSFAANQWGLYDLGGNAWEWCEDWFDSAQKDHLVRGASWRNGEREYLLSSRRVRNLASFKDSNIGFRIVLAPEGAK